MDKATYVKLRNSTKDPILLCYKIYNSEYPNVFNSPVDFLRAFQSWLKETGKSKLITESQRIKRNFDKKFAIVN